jgi:hypothetical protein
VSGALTEPDIIWSVPPSRDKPSSNSKTGTGTGYEADPAAGLPSLNNDDTLISINIVGGVVAFIAVLIIVICIIMGRANHDYLVEGWYGPLAAPGALSTAGRAFSSVLQVQAVPMSNLEWGCLCIWKLMNPGMLPL